MHKSLYKHLYKSLDRPSPLIVIEARLVRLLFTLSGNRAPDWVYSLASVHAFKDADERARFIRLIRRLEHPSSQAGRAIPAFGLFLLVLAAGVFLLLALAGQSGLALSSTLADVDVAPQDQATLADDLISLERPESIPDNLALVQAPSLDYSISHGLAHHGNDAKRVRDCMSSKGPAMTWMDPEGFRLQICQLPGTDQIGVQVETQRNGAWKSITEYIKNRFHSLRDISNWLYRCGAKPVR